MPGLCAAGPMLWAQVPRQPRAHYPPDWAAKLDDVGLRQSAFARVQVRRVCC